MTTKEKISDIMPDNFANVLLQPETCSQASNNESKQATSQIEAPAVHPRITMTKSGRIVKPAPRLIEEI